jgi:putative transcriptional regulator
MIAQQEFEKGRRITINEVADGAGMHRVTLSRMINKRGFATSTEHLDRLCKFFGCTLAEIAEYVPDDEVPGTSQAVKESEPRD